MSAFEDAVKVGLRSPEPPPTHPRLAELMRDVASGWKSVDEAWGLWLEFCEREGIEPVSKRHEL